MAKSAAEKEYSPAGLRRVGNPPFAKLVRCAWAHMRHIPSHSAACRTLTDRRARCPSRGMFAEADTRPYHRIGRWGRGRVRAVDLTPRDLAFLQTLFTFGALSTEMLGALIAPASPRRATTDRLFLLKNPPNDYVSQPEGQQFAKDANHTSLVYEISEKGVAALVDCGRVSYAESELWRKLQANLRPQHFDHDAATGYILASLALGAREANVRFISSTEILSRPKCPEETRTSENPLAIPCMVGGERRSVIPDALFGVEYPTGACFFALETDMGTEQIREHDLKGSTIVRKLRGYLAIMRDQAYRRQFALPSLQVLVVTASIVRMRNIIEALRRLTEPDASSATHAFLFKAIPELGRRTRDKLPVSGHMLTGPVRASRLSTDKSLNALTGLQGGHIHLRSPGPIRFGPDIPRCEEENMRYLVALFIPWLAFFTIGQVWQGFLCFFLQLSVIGWPPAAAWAFVVTNNYYADKRTDRIVNAIQQSQPARY